MSERLRPTDVPGQPGNIQNTRQIIDALTKHTSFSGTDAGELLSGLERLEAETEAEKVLKAPQVQDARAVVSSMLEKGFIPKASANSFLDCLNDPATAKVLKKYVLPVPNQDFRVTKKGVGRRKFLVGGALALGGLTLASLAYTGSEVDPIVDSLTPLSDSYRKILRNPFTADELPKGWHQVESYTVRRSVAHNAMFLEKLIEVIEFGGSEVRGVYIILQIPGKEKDSILYGLPGIEFDVFESPQQAQTVSKQYQYPGSRLVSGIGDMAWVDFWNSPPNTTSRIFVVDDKVLTIAIVIGDEQAVLSLGKSAVKYLARIGITPGVK